MVKIVNNQKVLEKVDIAQSSRKEEMAETLPAYMENGATYNGGSGTTADRPTTVVPGTVYYDTTLGYQVIWNGTDWVSGANIAGTKNIDHTDSPYALLTTDVFLFCDTDGGEITVNLHGEDTGKIGMVNCGTSANDVNVTPNGTDLIDGVNAPKALGDGGVIELRKNLLKGWR